MDPQDQSDGYHTFRELYDHRHALFIALCSELDKNRTPSPVWRSKLHADGTMYDGGWFIMGIYQSPGIQMSYHLPMSLWAQTYFAQELERAPKWDGHTPANVIERLRQFVAA